CRFGESWQMAAGSESCGRGWRIRLAYFKRFSAHGAKRVAGCRPLILAAAAGLTLTAVQVLLAVFLSGKGSIQAGWRSFYNYDSEWFVTVASYGYIDPNWKEGQSSEDPFAACTSEEFKSPRIRAQNNAHFFPAYPLFCRAVHNLTGLDWVATL